MYEQRDSMNDENMPVRVKDLLPVGAGLATGLLFATIARFIDAEFHNDAPTHIALDWAFSVALGLALGVAVSYGLRRARRARDRRARVEALERRLLGNEREQAVWVLASALLHDLRNPIHTVGLALEELARTSDNPEQEPLLAEARRSLDAIDAKFQQLREMAREPNSAMRSLDVTALVADVARRAGALASRRGVKLIARSTAPVFVLGDATMIQTSLENLLCNAIHAADGRSDAEVEVSIDDEDEAVVIRVEDNGPGVPKELAAGIFQPLRSTKASEDRGLGLGLPIARALARAQGGDLAVEPSNRGRFLLRLPHASAEA
jgi:two-component system C4-dicarboxylate transport sensor histidine kinase DctB